MVSGMLSASIAFMITAVSASVISAAAIPSNCLATDNVQPSDNCFTIVDRFKNFTATDLYKWNPQIGTNCFGLIAYNDICINVSGYVYPGPVIAGAIFTRDETPVPVQPDIVANCNKFEYTDNTGKPGFAAMFSQNRITKTQWNQLNWPSRDPTVDQPLYAAFFSCVGL